MPRSALALGYCMDTVRARALAWAGRALDRRLSPAALASALCDAAGVAGRADTDVAAGHRAAARLPERHRRPGAVRRALAADLHARDLRSCIRCSGWRAALGACMLVALGDAERAADCAVTPNGRCAARARPRATPKRSTRNAEVIVGMGMTRAAVAAWQERHDQLLDAQAQLGAGSSRLSALARVMRQGLQVVMLAPGRVAGDRRMRRPASWSPPPCCSAARCSRWNSSIGGWKALVEARGAWRAVERTPGRAACRRRPGIACPARAHRRGARRLFGRAQRPAADQERSAFSLAAAKASAWSAPAPRARPR